MRVSLDTHLIIFPDTRIVWQYSLKERVAARIASLCRFLSAGSLATKLIMIMVQLVR